MTEAIALPPQTVESEGHLIGALLVRPSVDAVVAETGLRAEHFYRQRHATIYSSILRLQERGEGIDAITVCDQLEREGKLEEVGGRAEVSDLASSVAVPGNALTYARRIVEDAQWRLHLQGGQLAVEAAHQRDPEKLTRAEELLGRNLVHANTDLDSAAQADIAFELMEGRETADFAYPFDRLNRATNGGMRRGQLIVISGYSSFGKSHFVDQILDGVHRGNQRAWLYLNEMTTEERVARKLNRMTGVPYSSLVAGKLEADQRTKVLERCNKGLGWGMTDVSSWSAEEVCHHIRRSRPDVAGVDLLNRFPWRDEREASRLVHLFDVTAKIANCALVLVCQLNERPAGAARQNSRAVFPAPVYTDLKGTGDIKNCADHVVFVHRKQDTETGEPLEEGAIYLGKVRGGKRAGVKTVFNDRMLRFQLAPREDEAPPEQEQGALVG